VIVGIDVEERTKGWEVAHTGGGCTNEGMIRVWVEVGMCVEFGYGL
jgi:hypothetical protein